MKEPPMSAVSFLKRCLPNSKIRTVFDVGANKGKLALLYAKNFPNAEIFSFEPVKSTFEMLIETVKEESKIKVFHIALGKNNGVARITNTPGGTGNRIVENNQPDKTEAVEMMTGDDFCQINAVTQIDFLKIDTEGLDLQVLQGFANMLKLQAIQLLQVECGMNAFNKKHVSLEEFKEYLAPLGYHLAWLVEPALDTRFSGLPLMRRSNAVFISMKTANKNRQERPKK